MNLSSNVNFLLQTQTQIKILHWQTKGYARHQAFGETYSNLDALIDDFVEIYMGKYGRFSLSENEKKISIDNLTELDLTAFMKTVKSELIGMSNDLSKDKDTDLLNLRDEMLGLFNKLSYLLTLE
jgi:DNA-binding ferritin-like protein